jgi:hypothetical protein
VSGAVEFARDAQSRRSQPTLGLQSEVPAWLRDGLSQRRGRERGRGYSVGTVET